MPTRRLLTLSALLLVTGAACSSITGVERDVFDGILYERRPSVLGYTESPPAGVTAPDTVSAGVPFTVTVATYGGGCIRLGDTEVRVAGSVAEVRPYEWFVSAGQAIACTGDIRRLEHAASVTLPTPGRATLRLIGRQLPEGATISIERTLVVR
jgi:hypothetical protein